MMNCCTTVYTKCSHLDSGFILINFNGDQFHAHVNDERVICAFYTSSVSVVRDDDPHISLTDTLFWNIPPWNRLQPRNAR